MPRGQARILRPSLETHTNSLGYFRPAADAIQLRYHQLKVRDFISLDLDHKFQDFFYCSIWDPALDPGSGPDESALFRMVYQARQNPKRGCAEFGDTMRWTLRQEAFECFQRLHGPRPIRFEHWFYAKLGQLVAILLYEELLVYGVGDSFGPEPPQTERPWEEGTGVLTGELPLIQPDDLEQAFSPRDSTEYDWAILVRTVLKAGEGRLTAFQRIIEERVAQREREASIDQGKAKESMAGLLSGSKRRGRPEIADRGNLIRSCMERDLDRFKICQILDAKGFPTTPQMSRNGHNKWTTAWQDPQFRNNVQQVFSKEKSRR